MTQGPANESGTTKDSAQAARPLLEVSGLTSGYGPVQVLHGVDLHVSGGEIVAVLGANGAGKSTLMQTLVGMVRPTGGRIALAGEEVAGRSPEALVRRGMTLVPEGRRVFSRLTVQENLRMGGFTWRDTAALNARIEQFSERFPVLGDRRDQPAGTLSGGEQQMLAICRALLSRPRLLLLDEPSLGLAPVIVERVFELVRSLRDEDGLTIVLVEQSITEALGIADRAYVLENGRFTVSGTSQEVAAAAHQLERSYLGSETA